VKNLLLFIILLFCFMIACKEKRESKFQNGQLKEQYFVIKDKQGNFIKVGKYISWYENGQKESEETYKDGKANGLRTTWYENGLKKLEENQVNGTLNGPFIEWYENGKKASEGTYKNGIWVGKMTDWYENGQKKIEGTFNGKRDENFLVNGIEQGYIQNGIKDGMQTEWYENGQKKLEGFFKDGNEEGIVTNWYINGQKAGEWSYKDGKLDGITNKWYENGQKKPLCIYKDGNLLDKMSTIIYSGVISTSPDSAFRKFVKYLDSDCDSLEKLECVPTLFRDRRFDMVNVGYTPGISSRPIYFTKNGLEWGNDDPDKIDAVFKTYLHNEVNNYVLFFIKLNVVAEISQINKCKYLYHVTKPTGTALDFHMYCIE